MVKISGADNETPETTMQSFRCGSLLRQIPSIVSIFHDADHPSHLLLPITSGNIVGTFLSGGDLTIAPLKMT